jgi:hypothetical protein
MLHGCGLFHYDHKGQEAMLAMRLDQWATGGRTLHIMGAVSVGKRPVQARQLFGAVEHKARDLQADVLSLCTVHKAIAASAPRWGGQITGVIVTKQLGAVQ